MQPGATIKASNDRDKWPAPLDFITANGLNNIGIVGGGVIDGQGEVWWYANKKITDETKNT